MSGDVAPQRCPDVSRIFCLGDHRVPVVGGAPSAVHAEQILRCAAGSADSPPLGIAHLAAALLKECAWPGLCVPLLILVYSLLLSTSWLPLEVWYLYYWTGNLVATLGFSHQFAFEFARRQQSRGKTVVVGTMAVCWQTAICATINIGCIFVPIATIPVVFLCVYFPSARRFFEACRSGEGIPAAVWQIVTMSTGALPVVLGTGCYTVIWLFGRDLRAVYAVVAAWSVLTCMTEFLQRFSARRAGPVCPLTLEVIMRMYSETVLSYLGTVLFSRSGFSLVMYAASTALPVGMFVLRGWSRERHVQLNMFLSACVSLICCATTLLTMLLYICLRMLLEDVSQRKASWSWRRRYRVDPGFLGNEFFDMGGADAAGAGLCVASLIVVLAQFVCFFIVVPKVWRWQIPACCRRRLRRRRHRVQPSFSSVAPAPSPSDGPCTSVVPFPSPSDASIESQSTTVSDSGTYWLGASTLLETSRQELQLLILFMREHRVISGLTVFFSFQLSSLAMSAERVSRQPDMGQC